MKRKSIVFLMIFSLGFLPSILVSSVHALNFTPGVQVGHELVFEQSFPWGTYDNKHKITNISDSGDGTWVNGTINNSSEIYPLGYMGNYSTNPIYLIASYTAGTDIEISGGFFEMCYIIPGTILMDYSTGIIDVFDIEFDATITCASIADGLGIEIKGTIDGISINFKRTFNEQGILVEDVVKASQGGQTAKYYTKLKSINGERYRTIPGYSLYSIIFISGLTLVIIFRVHNKKINQNNI